MSQAIDHPNREGDAAYGIEWPWERARRTGEPLRRGTTTVLRVKNEAQSLPWVLPPLLRATHEVILVDNNSTDGTPTVALETAERHGLAERLRVFDYPFDVSRCGAEHLATPADSIRSLVYFYNWSFSHVRTAYSLKWDGDMVLTEDAEGLLRDLAWQLPGKDVILRVPRNSLYVESDRVAYLDLGLPNVEPFGYPMAPDYPHVKAFEWELRAWPDHAETMRLPAGASVELKWLGSDEFAHWTDPDSFAESSRTERKRREWGLMQAIPAGEWERFHNVHRIEAPEGVHVIDHVTHEWLPHCDRSLFWRYRQEPEWQEKLALQAAQESAREQAGSAGGRSGR